jgi:hypothetical protein
VLDLSVFSFSREEEFPFSESTTQYQFPESISARALKRTQRQSPLPKQKLYHSEKKDLVSATIELLKYVERFNQIKITSLLLWNF